MRPKIHDHLFQFEEAYWMVKVNDTHIQYYLDEQPDSQPVWLMECKICHQVQVKPRRLANDKEVAK